MFRPYRAIIRPYYKNRFNNHFHYILQSQIVYIDGMVVTMLYAIIYLNKLLFYYFYVLFYFYLLFYYFYLLFYYFYLLFFLNSGIQHCNNHTIYVNNLETQNVLEVIEPVLIIKPDDGPMCPKHVV